MDGHLLSSALEALVVLVQGLIQVDVDFSVILFGENIQLVKAEGQEWDAACVLSLLCRLNTMKQNCTRDAEAIGLAKHLLPAQGPRKIFVITDGFTSYGLKMADVLVDCMSDGVEVVAVSVGMDTSNVHRLYPRWVKAAVPAALPDAFRQLHEREAAGGGESGRAIEDGEPLDRQETEMWKKVRVVAANGIASEDLDTVLTERWDRFRVLQDMLREEKKELKLVTKDGPSRVTVDITFVIDSTGSMAPVVNSIRHHLFMILAKDDKHSIVSKVKHEFPDLDLEIRCGYLFFKDFKDSPQFTESMFEGGHFTSDTDVFLRKVSGSFHATGGDDQAEDIAGALRKAAEWGDWTGQARFLLLFTDAPCHGSDFSSGFTDSHVGQSAKSMEGFRAAFRAAIKNKISVVHCESYPEATQRTHLGMKKACDDAVKDALTAASRPVPKGECQLPQPREGSRYLKRVELVKADASGRQPTSRGGLHIVFVLDESGSMSGHPWQVMLGLHDKLLYK